MPPYKQVAILTSEQAAYLAGLIDGEGSISLTRRHRSQRRSLAVTISNNEREILEYAREVIGVGRIANKRVYQSGHRPSFTYIISNRQALSLLQQIYLCMKSYKARRAELALKWYVELTPRNGKCTPEQEKKREDFVLEFLALRSNARQTIASSV